jgi:hypothetical protein
MKRQILSTLAAVALGAMAILLVPPVAADPFGTEHKSPLGANPNCWVRIGGLYPADLHFRYCGTEPDHGLSLLKTFLTLAEPYKTLFAQKEVTIYIYQNADEEAQATFSASEGITLTDWIKQNYEKRLKDQEIGEMLVGGRFLDTEIIVFSQRIPASSTPRFINVSPSEKDHVIRHEAGHVADYLLAAQFPGGVQYSDTGLFQGFALLDRTRFKQQDPTYPHDSAAFVYFLASGKEGELFAETFAMAWEHQTIPAYQYPPLDTPIIETYFRCTYRDVYSLYTTARVGLPPQEDVSCISVPPPHFSPFKWDANWTLEWLSILPLAQAAAAPILRGGAGDPAALMQLRQAAQALPASVPRPITCLAFMDDAVSKSNSTNATVRAQAPEAAKRSVECYEGMRVDGTCASGSCVPL